jgi:hypothetical protein
MLCYGLQNRSANVFRRGAVEGEGETKAAKGELLEAINFQQTSLITRHLL